MLVCSGRLQYLITDQRLISEIGESQAYWCARVCGCVGVRVGVCGCAFGASSAPRNGSNWMNT